MDHTIIYFTGTGNSLAVARSLAGKLTGTNIVSVSSILAHPGFTVVSDTCGIIFPVYCQDAPEIVKRAVGSIKIPASTYVYAVATHNGDPGYSHFTLDRILRKKRQHLRAGFAVLMPGNSIAPFDYTNSNEETTRRLQSAETSIDGIAADINARKSIPYMGSNSLRKHLRGLRNAFRHRVIYKVPKSFWVMDSCNRCGLCARICPEQNISITPDGLVWHSHCQMCYACIHWCPQRAVQNGKGTIDRKRYHHPEISPKDMLDGR